MTLFLYTTHSILEHVPDDAQLKHIEVGNEFKEVNGNIKRGFRHTARVVGRIEHQLESITSKDAIALDIAYIMVRFQDMLKLIHLAVSPGGSSAPSYLTLYSVSFLRLRTASTKEITKVAHDEVKTTRQVVKRTREFKHIQLQELKTTKEKLREKTAKITSVWESYKHMLKLVRKLGVIVDIKIIPNTKPLKVNIMRDNDDSNIEESVEVYMDDFSVFGNSFDNCLNNLDKIIQRCKDAHLVLK
ncbi:hypothetical protein Tco_0448946 [Tanacetum coccineum]